jgi:prepilin-type N-terminal cleavage/methylation domain-containing protein
MKPARKNAFTLIELLVVIAIVGVLAAVVLVAINPAKRMRQARDSGRKSDIGQIATSLQAYFTSAATGLYPGGSGAPGGLTALTATGDLKSIPKQPNGSDYNYTVNGTSSEAAVYAPVEDPTTGAGSYVWCWNSSSGMAREVTGTTCTP